MTGAIARVARALAGLVYPRRAVCMGCGTAAGFDADWLCPDCRRALAADWVGAAPFVKGVDAAACAYVYRGAAAGVVRRMKYSGIYRLAGLMGADMVRAHRAIAYAGADCVVPVPMHRGRLRRRGYNHAELLARDVAARLGLPCVDALARVRSTQRQALLGEAERLSNLQGAFALRSPVEGRRVLLVDDVCTTGATARACAEVLRAGGAASVCLLCYSAALPARGNPGAARGDAGDGK